MSQIRRTLAARLVAVASLAGCAGAFAQSEVEPNNTIGTAGAPTGVPIVRTGVISPNTDVDYYAVTVPAGTSLRIRAIPTSHTCQTSDLDLTFYNSSGTELAYNDDSPGQWLCPDLNPATLPAMVNLAAGTYYIKVGNVNTFVNNIAYDLAIDVALLPQPLTPTFTYQGRLLENEAEVNGPRDFTVTLWNHPTSTSVDNRVGAPLYFNTHDVLNGLFVLNLNFGAQAFDGSERYIEIAVDYSGQGPGGAVLGPRTRLSPAPHAVIAMNAKEAEHAALATTATTANHAMDAAMADSADVANLAVQSYWSGIQNMPPAFADGNDDDGPWSINGSILYYTGGGVAIGTTNPSGFLFAVNGTAAKSGGGSWSTFCDSRLKHDIRPLSGTLDKLLGLRGYTFEYNDEAVEKRLAMRGTQIGLMAEEVERVFPDWVEKDGDGYRYVTERATTALMVEALRDLRVEKDAALAEKQRQIDALEARLRRIEESMK
ncbi:hypothetical protein PHYC_01583 [Phycisphaerales bacterium]|nr:hypothetical protein PHYC_01583 [Phycisphaerales bacterium]